MASSQNASQRPRQRLIGSHFLRNDGFCSCVISNTRSINFWIGDKQVVDTVCRRFRPRGGLVSSSGYVRARDYAQPSGAR